MLTRWEGQNNVGRVLGLVSKTKGSTGFNPFEIRDEILLKVSR